MYLELCKQEVTKYENWLYEFWFSYLFLVVIIDDRVRFYILQVHGWECLPHNFLWDTW